MIKDRSKLFRWAMLVSLIVITLCIPLIVLELVLKSKDYQSLCDKALNDQIKFYDPFTIDQEGHFRHNLSIINTLRNFDEFSEIQFEHYFKNMWLTEQDLSDKYLTLSYLSRHSEWNLDSISYHEQYGHLLLDLFDDIKAKGFDKFESNLSGEFIRTGEEGLNSSVKDYLQMHINGAGYRSIDFENYTSDRQKLLLLGDSFTYGFSAMPLHNSFANKLLENGHIVYNLAIPGTGLNNYYQEAMKYVPELKPDHVFLFFYLANDQMVTDEILMDGFNNFYATNYGWLYSTVEGTYYGDKESWIKELKDCCNNRSIQIFPFRLRVMEYFNEKIINRFTGGCIFIKTTPATELATRKAILEIKDLSEKTGAQFHLILIPDCQNSVKEHVDKLKTEMFKSLDYPNMDAFTAADFRCDENDPHFNNQGHRKMGAMINSIVNSPE